MRRRHFITLLGGAAAAWPFASRAQQRKAIPRVGVLWHAADAEEEAEYLGVLTKAFHDLGYFEGKTIELDHRFPAEQPERFRTLAQELVASKVDVIVAVTGLGAKMAKQATSTIPIVIVADPDPVGNGLVESLARPGGNVTGLSLMVTDLSGKRLALFKEVVPKLVRVAIVIDPRDPFSRGGAVAFEKAAKAAGLLTRIFEATTPDEVEDAFSAIARDGFDGACTVGPPMYIMRARVGASAMAHRVPTLAGSVVKLPYGLLLSYGPDFPDYFRRAVGYVDKILKGAKPSDLPIEQPTRFKLVINLKTANALGLTVPPALVSTADEVIE
jgi:putative tryptophan/tyrosine transport system substrate-binding protein